MAPSQAPSSSPTVVKPSRPPASVVPSVTALEYQPVRVLMSVLFMPQAPTAISTSSAAISGTGQSS